MAKQEQFIHAQKRLISSNHEIDSHERKLRMAVVGRVREIQELRSLCPHKRIVEFRESGEHDAVGCWEHRDRFCLDCGDREHLSELSKPKWIFERLVQEPSHEVEKKHMRLFMDRLHVEGRLDAVQALVTKKQEENRGSK